MAKRQKAPTKWEIEDNLTPNQQDVYYRVVRQLRGDESGGKANESEEAYIRRSHNASVKAYRIAKRSPKERAHYETKKRTLLEKVHGHVALAKHHLRKLGIKSHAPKPVRRRRKKSSHRAKRRGRK